MKLVSRGDTTVVDAYLSPILRRYVEQVAGEMPGVKLFFMQSSGGLADAHAFQGKDAILSGPAGGIVGMVRTAQLAGFDQVIGFDMGGTSTDVSHFAGEFERAFETQVAGVRMRAPMMSIHTVAAGGGSILGFDGARLRVGPQSAGANPGPASYRRGGPLAVTDANVMLGKIQPRVLPEGVRPGGRRAARAATSCVAAFDALAARSRSAPAATRAEEVAEGFIDIAVRQHGQRDQEDLGGARLRRHALHAAVLRRRRRPARLPGGRCAGHDARVRASAGRRAVGLRHGPGRPERDARGGGRAAAGDAGAAGGARERSTRWPPRRSAELRAPGRRAPATVQRAPARARALRGHRLGAGRALRRRSVAIVGRASRPRTASASRS